STRSTYTSRPFARIIATAFQLLACSVPGRYRPFLVLRSEIVIVKNVVSARERSGSPLQGRGKPYGCESRAPECVCLSGEMVPPERSRVIAVERRWDAVHPAGTKKEPLKKYAQFEASYAP